MRDSGDRLVAFLEGAAEGFEKGKERFLLVGFKMQRAQLRVQGGIGSASLVVELNHIRQGGETSVVHVGRGTEHLTQGGYLEFAAIFLFAGDLEAARVRQLALPLRDAGVVEPFVGEGRTQVAGRAVRLAAKQA